MDITKIDPTSGKEEETSKFSIKKVFVRRERIDGGYKHINSYLRVQLEPDIYFRQRGFGGESVERKKNPAILTIRYDELQQMFEAFEEELQACHRVLSQSDLLFNIDEMKEKMRNEQKERADQNARREKPAA